MSQADPIIFSITADHTPSKSSEKIKPRSENAPQTRLKKISQQASAVPRRGYRFSGMESADETIEIPEHINIATNGNADCQRSNIDDAINVHKASACVSDGADPPPCSSRCTLILQAQDAPDVEKQTQNHGDPGWLYASDINNNDLHYDSLEGLSLSIAPALCAHEETPVVTSVSLLPPLPPLPLNQTPAPAVSAEIDTLLGSEMQTEGEAGAINEDATAGAGALSGREPPAPPLMDINISISPHCERRELSQQSLIEASEERYSVLPEPAPCTVHDNVSQSNTLSHTASSNDSNNNVGHINTPTSSDDPLNSIIGSPHTPNCAHAQGNIILLDASGGEESENSIARSTIKGGPAPVTISADITLTTSSTLLAPTDLLPSDPQAHPMDISCESQSQFAAQRVITDVAVHSTQSVSTHIAGDIEPKGSVEYTGTPTITEECSLPAVGASPSDQKESASLDPCLACTSAPSEQKESASLDPCLACTSAPSVPINTASPLLNAPTSISSFPLTSTSESLMNQHIPSCAATCSPVRETVDCVNLSNVDAPEPSSVLVATPVANESNKHEKKRKTLTPHSPEDAIKKKGIQSEVASRIRQHTRSKLSATPQVDIVSQPSPACMDAFSLSNSCITPTSKIKSSPRGSAHTQSPASTSSVSKSGKSLRGKKKSGAADALNIEDSGRGEQLDCVLENSGMHGLGATQAYGLINTSTVDIELHNLRHSLCELARMGVMPPLAQAVFGPHRAVLNDDGIFVDKEGHEFPSISIMQEIMGKGGLGSNGWQPLKVAGRAIRDWLEGVQGAGDEGEGSAEEGGRKKKKKKKHDSASEGVVVPPSPQFVATEDERGEDKITSTTNADASLSSTPVTTLSAKDKGSGISIRVGKHVLIGDDFLFASLVSCMI